MKIEPRCHLFYVITKLKDKIRRHFGFSATEIRGLFVLVPLVIALLILPDIVRRMLVKDNHEQIARDEEILLDWLKESQNKIKPEVKSIAKDTKPFDPNQLSINEWMDLGFTQKIAERIINYTNKGGRFYKKEDLLKIYGIDKDLVTSYFKLLKFPKRMKKPKATNQAYASSDPSPRYAKADTIKTDINLADTILLREIKGIGPVLSSRIVRYRNALGGFFSMDQLSEVYGIKPELLQKLLAKFEVQSMAIQKVNINEDSIKALARHPYLSYKVSKALVQYRKQHGDYQTIDEIRQVHVITDSIFQRISIYLKTSASE